MKVNGMQSNEVLLKELGSRLKSKRISMSITQTDLAKESGVSLRTIINMENGENTSLNNFISVIRVLRMIENLELFIPEQKNNPEDVYNLGHKRQRVSKPKTVKEASWVWGNDK